MEGEGLHVCIIDDDGVYQFISKRLLQSIQPAVRLTFFSNGQEAIDYLTSQLLLHAHLPDLLLLDINMPVMNGWEFLLAFKNLAAQLPKTPHIYLISSSVNIADRQKAACEPLVADYLVKPVGKDRLKEILARTSCGTQ